VWPLLGLCFYIGVTCSPVFKEWQASSFFNGSTVRQKLCTYFREFSIPFGLITTASLRLRAFSYLGLREKDLTRSLSPLIEIFHNALVATPWALPNSTKEGGDTTHLRKLEVALPAIPVRLPRFVICHLCVFQQSVCVCACACVCVSLKMLPLNFSWFKDDANDLLFTHTRRHDACVGCP